MRLKQILIYAGLLVVALVAAWFTWTHEPPGGKGDVTVIDLSAKQLTRVVYEQEDLQVLVELKAHQDGDFCWGEATKTRDAPKPPKKPPFARDDDDSAEEPEPADVSDQPERITEHKVFRGNQTCDKVLERFAPMKAMREFENLSDEKLAEMGLEAPETTLLVANQKGDRTFDVGERSYGSNNYYLRDQDSKQVFLVESRLIGDIKGGATRLMEKDVLDFGREDIANAVVQVGKEMRPFAQQNRDDKKNAYWADPADLTQPADAADTWMSKVLRMRALEYYPELPMNLQLAGMVTFRDERGELGWIEFGTATDSDGQPIHVARSARTVAWVQISDNSGSEILEELPEVMGN